MTTLISLPSTSLVTAAVDQVSSPENVRLQPAELKLRQKIADLFTLIPEANTLKYNEPDVKEAIDPPKTKIAFQSLTPITVLEFKNLIIEATLLKFSLRPEYLEVITTLALHKLIINYLGFDFPEFMNSKMDEYPNLSLLEQVIWSNNDDQTEIVKVALKAGGDIFRDSNQENQGHLTIQEAACSDSRIGPNIRTLLDSFPVPSKRFKQVNEILSIKEPKKTIVYALERTSIHHTNVNRFGFTFQGQQSFLNIHYSKLLHYFISNLSNLLLAQPRYLIDMRHTNPNMFFELQLCMDVQKTSNREFLTRTINNFPNVWDVNIKIENFDDPVNRNTAVVEVIFLFQPIVGADLRRDSITITFGIFDKHRLGLPLFPILHIPEAPSCCSVQ